MSTESEAILASLGDELKDNVFRGVGGFLTKFFEDQSWSAAIQNIINATESADVVNRLSADLFNIANLDSLVEWLATFQSLFFADNPSLHLWSKSIDTQDSRFSASIYLEASNVPVAGGRTRVYGEFCHGDALVARGDGDFLRFGIRALQVFKDQPTRHFLHAFLLYGTTLELWVFDRSGAYSSERLNLAQSPHLVLRILAGYGMMSGHESGFNTFVKRLGPETDGCVAFDQSGKVYLQPEMIAAPSYLVGLATTCFAASGSTTAEPNIVVKLSWRIGTAPAELQLLKLAKERNVWGVVQLVGHQDLVSIADLRQGLQFPRPFVNRTLSCVATSPLGRPIRKFASISELLEVLGDLVEALRSLYVNGRMLHRDIAIKNLVINPQPIAGSSKGVLIDFDLALDLDKARAIEPMVGSDGFMAIGILSGQRHTYRHDIESLFYVFLWLAIANDSEHDHALDILEGLPKTSRLWKWCTMDFRAVGQAKAVDMSPEGFVGILDEFSAEFVQLKDLAQELHRLLFPMRDGRIFTGTETEQEAVERLYANMADAFNRSALAFQK